MSGIKSSDPRKLLVVGAFRKLVQELTGRVVGKVTMVSHEKRTDEFHAHCMEKGSMASLGHFYMKDGSLIRHEFHESIQGEVYHVTIDLKTGDRGTMKL